MTRGQDATIGGGAFSLAAIAELGFTWTTLWLLVLMAVLVVAVIRHGQVLDHAYDWARSKIAPPRATGERARDANAEARTQSAPSKPRTWLTRASQPPRFAAVGFGLGAVAGAAVGDSGRDDGGKAEDDQAPTAVTDATAAQTSLSLAIANVTDGDEDYGTHVSAGYDDVVKAQLTYSNDGSEPVGLTIAFRLSDLDDTRQHVTADVTVNEERALLSVPVDLERDDGALSFTSGSLVWRHPSADDPNTYVEEVLPDAFAAPVEVARVPAGTAGTITVLARVLVRSVSINLDASSPTHPEFAPLIDAAPGDIVTYEVTVGNEGNAPLRDAVVLARLAPSQRYVPGSTQLDTGNGFAKAGDEIVSAADPSGSTGTLIDGLHAGDIGIGANVQVRFDVQLPGATGRVYCTVATVGAVGINVYYNTAAVGLDNVPESCNG